MSRTRSKNWVFTLNNYTEEDCKAISAWACKGVAYSKEVGASGTPHLQGFVCFAVQKSLKALKALSDRAHWEVMKGSLKQNEAYCSKAAKLTTFGKWGTECSVGSS